MRLENRSPKLLKDFLGCIFFHAADGLDKHARLIFFRRDVLRLMPAERHIFYVDFVSERPKVAGQGGCGLLGGFPAEVKGEQRGRSERNDNYKNKYYL